MNFDAIQIKSPCPVSWDEMKGDDATRFCRHCKLNVYNFSEMTRADAERLILEKEGRLCARFFRRADGTILTRDCTPIRVSKARRAAAITVCVTLGMIMGCAMAIAQDLGRNRYYQATFERLRRSRIGDLVPMRKTINWIEASLPSALPPGYPPASALGALPPPGTGVSSIMCGVSIRPSRPRTLPAKTAVDDRIHF